MVLQYNTEYDLYRMGIGVYLTRYYISPVGLRRQELGFRVMVAPAPGWDTDQVNKQIP